jgi:hypothetical protein
MHDDSLGGEPNDPLEHNGHPGRKCRHNVTSDKRHLLSHQTPAESYRRCAGLHNYSESSGNKNTVKGVARPVD